MGSIIVQSLEPFVLQTSLLVIDTVIKPIFYGVGWNIKESPVLAFISALFEDLSSIRIKVLLLMIYYILCKIANLFVHYQAQLVAVKLLL